MSKMYEMLLWVQVGIWSSVSLQRLAKDTTESAIIADSVA